MPTAKEILTTLKSKSRKGGKKSRKHGNVKKKPTHQRYNNEGRALKNKKRKLARHLYRYPKDAVAQASWDTNGFTKAA